MPVRFNPSPRRANEANTLWERIQNFFLAVFRLLQTACTANLLVAILCVFVYAVYLDLKGVPLHENFLGVKQFPEAVPKRGWMIVLLLEMFILITFIWFREVKKVMRVQRLYCAVLGLVGIWLLFQPLLQIMPPISDDGEILPRPGIASLTSGGKLGLYVWCSHLLYAVFGWHEE